MRQLTWAGGALALTVPASIALGVPAPIALLFIAGAPLLAFLLLEQQVASASSARQRRLLAELPVVHGGDDLVVAFEAAGLSE